MVQLVGAPMGYVTLARGGYASSSLQSSLTRSAARSTLDQLNHAQTTYMDAIDGSI